MIVLVPLAFTAYMVLWGMEMLIAFGALFVSSSWLALAIGLAFVYALGLLLTSRWFTEKLTALAGRFKERLPRLSIALRFLSGGEEAEAFQLGSYPEVEFETLPDIWVLGNVVKKWREGNRIWCSVYCGTIPVPLTGYLIRKMPEDRLRYTGRTAQETILTYLSFGMR
ncbi:MAG: hypothetical protein Q8Q41_02205 [bacterium]|nr:hypothetical protein [bacterium]